MSLERNKALLVEAHRNGDWESAKRLSQEREALKRKRMNRCIDCGTPIGKKSRTHKQPKERCGLCSIRHRFYGPRTLCKPS